MARGLGNSAIAAELFISDGGVHQHIRNIFATLGLAPDDRTDRRVTAVLRYLRETAPAGAWTDPARPGRPQAEPDDVVRSRPHRRPAACRR
ncbi:LuxR C-terminal-related transcriptional regulator [Amycolatopsis mediterranei]|uniref:LuxR C-terminal-related transcriptional regulator n=1 Tax=Amycolatopsis mediterranei TaxID=33910 RepID=UPI003F4D8C49